MAEVSGAFDGDGEVFGGSERIDMTSASGKPAIQTIAEGGSVGHGYVEGAGGLQDAPDFSERAFQIIKMLQAVIRDDGVEGLASEWEVRGVRLGEIWDRGEGVADISAGDDKFFAGGVKAARARSEIQHALAWTEIP